MAKKIRELKLARGLLFRNGNVLLVKDIRPGQGHHFLPGGSVEPGESVKNALAREWMEELAWPITAGNFVGCLEHHWSYTSGTDKDLIEVFEMNYLFSVMADEAIKSEKPVSKEAHLEFSWIPISHLNTIKLLPEPLKALIPKIAREHPTGAWVSTVE